MNDTVGAEPGERTRAAPRATARARPATLVTRLGKLERESPATATARFSTEPLRALYNSFGEGIGLRSCRDVCPGVYREVKAINERNVWPHFPRFGISHINKGLEKSLGSFGRLGARRKPYPADPRRPLLRKCGRRVILPSRPTASHQPGGLPQGLGGGTAGRESQTSWRDFLASLRARGLQASSSCLRTPSRTAEEPYWRCSPKPPGNAATCISCVTLLTPAPEANDDCLQEVRGSTIAGTWRSHRKTSQPGSLVAEDLSQALRLGGENIARP
jgi:hypothetical protein